MREFVQERFFKDGEAVPARLQTALALLERLREHVSFDLRDHLTEESGSSLRSHESLGKAVHDRLNLQPVVIVHGRRSNNIQSWGQDFLNMVSAYHDKSFEAHIDNWQATIAEYLREIINQAPIEVKLKGKLAKAIVGEVLIQADKRKLAGSIAQYLVGAKLRLKFPAKQDLITVAGANLADRTSSAASNRRADFDLGDHVFEVTVGPPDAKHFDQVQSIISESDAFVWLLVREDRLGFWADEARRRSLDMRRLAIASIEQFVGQNISELGDMTIEGEMAQIRRLFDEYNEVWISQFGTNGMRVEAK